MNLTMLLVLTVYVCMWMPAAMIAARLISTRGRCHGGAANRSTCQGFHAPDCWRSDPVQELTFQDAARACVVALVWPLAALPYLVMRTFRPVPAPYQRRIDELERELGLNDGSTL